MKKLVNKISLGSYVSWIGCLLGLISLNVPFLKGNSRLMDAIIREAGGLTLMKQPDGIPLLVFIIIMAVITIFHRAILSIISSGLLLALTLYEYYAAKSMIDANLRIASISFSTGMYLLIISAILIFAGAIMFLVEKIRNKQATTGAPLNGTI